jgi:hypothetical protein
MEIITYKQHLFFNITSIHIKTLVLPFHKSLENCGVNFFLPTLQSSPADQLDVSLRYSFAIPRNSEPSYGLFDLTGNVKRTWVAFLCGYRLLPYICPQKPPNDTVFYCGTRLLGPRHVVRAALSVW